MKIGPATLVGLILVGLGCGLLIAGVPTHSTLMVFGGILITYLTVCHPVLIIAVLLCLVPFNILWLGKGITPLEIIYGLMYVLLAFFWVFKRIVRIGRPRVLASPVSLPLAIFLCVMGLSCIIGILRGHTFQHWGSDLNGLMYYGLGFIVLDTVRDKKTLYQILGLVLVALVFGVIQNLSYIEITRPFGIPITIEGVIKIRTSGMISLVALLICVAIATCSTRARTRFLFIALSFLFGCMVLLSFSRATWVAAVSSLAFLFLVSIERHKRGFLRLVLLVILVFSLFILFVMLLPAGHPLSRLTAAVEDRYGSILSARLEPQMISRDSERAAAMKKAMRHPFLGNGLGTEFTYFRYDKWFGVQTWETTRYIHNAYIFVFLNMGLIGVLSFVWLIVSLVRYSLGLYRSLHAGMDKALALGISCAFISLIIASFAGPLLTTPILTMWIGFLVGALFIIDTSQRATA